MESVWRVFPVHLRETLKQCGIKKDLLEEIRIRIGQPMILLYGLEEWYLNLEEEKLCLNIQNGYVTTENDMRQMITFLSRYSLYAFEEELKSGFITLEGGHRVGLAGQVTMEEHHVINMRYINFLNIRIAKQRLDCAKEMIPYIIHQRNIYNTLIVSSPGIGKTTYLRDSIRLLSKGNAFMEGLRICVIDERSEIAACHQGVPQNDIGPRTDVLDRCQKAEGMLMMLRSMSPQIIAVDELGANEDFIAMEQALYSGSKILGTIHAGDMKELSEKGNMKMWVERKIFKRYILLRKNEAGNRVFDVFDENMEKLC